MADHLMRGVDVEHSTPPHRGRSPDRPGRPSAPPPRSSDRRAPTAVRLPGRRHRACRRRDRLPGLPGDRGHARRPLGDVVVTVSWTGHEAAELAWETVELVLGGIGEAAQQAWHEDPQNWTAEEIAEEMAVRRYEARRDEF